LLKQAKAGKPVPEDDIPPAVAVSASKSTPTVVQAEQPSVPTRQAPAPPAVQNFPAPQSRNVPAELQSPAAAPGGTSQPVPKPRAIVHPGTASTGQASAGAPSVSVAKAALSAPSIPLQTGPASAVSPERGKFLCRCSTLGAAIQCMRYSCQLFMVRTIG
jgi:hypothetical protein